MKQENSTIKTSRRSASFRGFRKLGISLMMLRCHYANIFASICKPDSLWSREVVKGNLCWRLLEIVATSPVALRWLCDSPRTGCAWRITPLCMWREQAIIEWSRRVISTVACCHGAKLCAHAARDFRWQHNVVEMRGNACSRYIYYGVILHAHPVRGEITKSTQHHRRGCNKTQSE